MSNGCQKKSTPLAQSSLTTYLRRVGDRVRPIARRWINWANKRNVVQFGIRAAILPLRVTKIQEAQERQRLEQEDIVVLSVVRDGAHWLRGFLKHHRGLGVRHFVILDNGSADETHTLLRGQSDVTLLYTDAPYHAYENTMKRFLVRNFAKERWCLFVDVDELFDWPLRGERHIGDLISYLDENEYNAVICQMLDMWSPSGLGSVRRSVPPHEICTHYSLADVEKGDYPFWDTNRGRDSSIKMHGGGIRKTLFGTSNGLTKVSLFKAEPQIRPFSHWHHIRNASIADFTCVLYHYPLTADFAAKAAEAAASGRYGYVTSGEYEAYHRTLEKTGELSFNIRGGRALVGTDELLVSRFLTVSPTYENHFL
jgi:hypothetical protein